MKPALFEYQRPESIAGVLALLAERGENAKIIAGGQSLVPMMNLRMARPDVVIDINRLPDLDYHRIEAGELVIGALARHEDLFASAVVSKAAPLMHLAYRYVAHSPIRNRGTLCGNLCHADPASEMPAVVQALGATLVLKSMAGERRIAATAFFQGTYLTDLRPDEMLVEVRIPVSRDCHGVGFHEVSIRKGDFAIVAVCAQVAVSADALSAAHIAVCGVGSRSVRLESAERALVAAAAKIDKISLAAVIETASKIAAQSVTPQDDVNGTAAYRRDLVRVLTHRALSDAVSKFI